MQCFLPVLLVAALVAISTQPAPADVTLPHVIGENMVLQRDKPVPIWGWADPGEIVTVTFGDRSAKATADAHGKWIAHLDPMLASTDPGTLLVKGNNEIRLANILVGEVWLCSGQSNMEWPVASSNAASEEIASANWPLIRHIKMPRQPASLPVDDREANWQVCSPASVAQFTACGFFFARKLHQELGVPIGLLNASWGGTRIEPWTPPVGFEGVPSLAPISRSIALADPANPAHKKRLGEFVGEVESWLTAAREAVAKGDVPDPQPQLPGELQPLANRKNPQQQPTTLFNGMIHPLVPFALRGVIWYQGESNHTESDYTEKSRALIEGWRKVWAEPDLPFYFVQIAPYKYDQESPDILPRFWEQQAAVLDVVPNTGMAVIHDIGDVNDIHPRNKQGVGLRLALHALSHTYKKTDIVFSGPRFKSMSVDGNKIRVSFDHAGTGLASRDGKPLSHWEILGEGTGWEPALATIAGKDAVLVSSPKIPQPVSVRLGWHKLASPNLMNGEGLPAAPFRAGDILQPDLLDLHLKEARDQQLVYDIDLSNLGPDPRYTTDNSGKLKGVNFARVTYFLELQKGGGPIHYAAVSMDAFTHDPSKLGIPTVKSAARFQQPIKNLTVRTSFPGVATGENLPGGHLEFWPDNYRPSNSANVEGASDAIYDFGDEPADPRDGHGSMQVHNIAAKQTVFAINMWKAGANADIGIGDSPGQHRDWTFAKNGGQYTLKRLRVFVK